MCQCVIKVNQFPDHTPSWYVCYWCWTFSRKFSFSRKLIRKFSRKLIRKFRENDNENGRNFAKINYFRLSFENFAKEILRKFGNLSELRWTLFTPSILDTVEKVLFCCFPYIMYILYILSQEFSTKIKQTSCIRI